MRRGCRVQKAPPPGLFDPPKVRPTWVQFPAPIRQETIRLLVQVLRDHLARRGQARQKGGVADE